MNMKKKKLTICVQTALFLLVACSRTDNRISKENTAEIRLLREVNDAGTTRTSVTFKNREIDIAADLYLPPNFDKNAKYPAIVFIHPGSGVKEQTAGLYANNMAKNGFVTIAYDASYYGQSEGNPRRIEDPAVRIEDVRCAIDYLDTLPYVDYDRIGATGICAGGGYAVATASIEKRIKAVATVSGSDYGYAQRGEDAKAAIEKLEAIALARTDEVQKNMELYTADLPEYQTRVKEPDVIHKEQEEDTQVLQARQTDVDLEQSRDYYYSRGYSPNTVSGIRVGSIANVMAFDAYQWADTLLTQPLIIFIGDNPGFFNSPASGRKLYEMAASEDKELIVVEGASHFDLYDKPEFTDHVIAQLTEFFNRTL